MDKEVQDKSGHGEGSPSPSEPSMEGQGSSKVVLSKEEQAVGTALTKILILETTVNELDYLIGKMIERQVKMKKNLETIKEEYKLLRDGQMTMPVESEETKVN